MGLDDIDREESKFLDETQRLTGWSTSGILTTGLGTQVGTEAVARPVGPTAQLQADFSRTVGAGNFTVQFSLIPQGIQQPNAFYMAEAMIQMTVQGNTVKRRINVMNGTSFTGTAEAVRVVVWDTTPTNPLIYPGSPAFPAGLPYLVVITVARGTRPYRITPPILMPPASNFGASQNNAPGSVTVNNSNANFIIPQDAGVTSVFAIVADINNAFGAAGNHSNQILVDIQGTGPLAAFFPVQYQSGLWVPAPPGAQSVFVNVNAGGGATSAQLLTVYFGIDG